MSKPTSTPWAVTPDGFRIWSEGEAKIVAYLAFNQISRNPEAHANAELIVRAVNSQEAVKALAEALRNIVSAAKNGANLERWYDHEIDELWAAADAALAQYEETTK